MGRAKRARGRGQIAGDFARWTEARRGLGSASMSSPEARHVLLIHVDQWRGDCLSIDGHPVVHTPHLDELAQDGCRFARAYSACPTCIPARAALMTGLTQGSHGRVGYEDGVEWNYPVTMAGAFKQGGFQTHCVGKLHAYPQSNRLGFESSELHDGHWQFWRDRRGGRDLAEDDDYLKWLRAQPSNPPPPPPAAKARTSSMRG
jgi:arylsulfatase